MQRDNTYNVTFDQNKNTLIVYMCTGDYKGHIAAWALIQYKDVVLPV